VLGSRARWFESVPQRSKAKDPAPLKVKEVWVEERRYIVCLNEEERRNDAHDREAIVAHLKEQLRNGDKSLVGNKGCTSAGSVATLQEYFDKLGRYGPRTLSRRSVQMAPIRTGSQSHSFCR
jgi:hypothetical protein